MTDISAKIIDGTHWRIVARYNDGCETAFAENTAVSLGFVESHHKRMHDLRGPVPETPEKPE